MSRTRPAYPPEFRHQMVELVRSNLSLLSSCHRCPPAALQCRRDLARPGGGTGASLLGIRQEGRLAVPANG